MNETATAAILRTKVLTPMSIPPSVAFAVIPVVARDPS